MTCTCHPDHLELGGWDKGCPVHDPGARAEATAARIAADIAAGRTSSTWDEGSEQRLAQAADKALTERLFAEAGLS